MIRAVVEQHAVEAAFLWTTRSALARSRRARLVDLARADERLEANLDGLRIAGRGGVKIVERALEDGEAGEVFVGAALALESGSADRVARALELAPDAHAYAGFAGALAWLPMRVAERGLALVCAARGGWAAALSAEACVAHRREIGGGLDAALLDDDPAVRAAGLRAVAALGRADRAVVLRAAMFEDDRACRFEAARAGVVSGDDAAPVVLRAIAEGVSAYAEQAGALAAISLDAAEAATSIAHLRGMSGRERAAIRAAAALGDVRAMPMLFEALNVPELARIAGEAFTTITGVELRGELAGDAPPGFASGPNDDPDDDDVRVDRDGELAWPQAPSVRAAWSRMRASFPEGVRHLRGVRVTPDRLRSALADGTQPERALAAIELARAGAASFDVTAPSRAQARALAALGLAAIGLSSFDA